MISNKELFLGFEKITTIKIPCILEGNGWWIMYHSNVKKRSLSMAMVYSSIAFILISSVVMILCLCSFQCGITEMSLDSNQVVTLTDLMHKDYHP